MCPLFYTNTRTWLLDIQSNSVMTLMNLNTNEKEVVTLVDPRLADRKNGKIPRNTVLGKALMGHYAGDVVEFRFHGEMIRYYVLEVRK